MSMFQGLRFFVRTSDRRTFNLVSFHSPHSMVWLWILSFSFPQSDFGRRIGFHRWHDNNGTQWMIQFARCCLRWHSQRPMWYRDCYQRLRDQRDGLANDDDDYPAMPVPVAPFEAPATLQ